MAFSISYTYTIIDKWTRPLGRITASTRQFTRAAGKAVAASKHLDSNLAVVPKRMSAMNRSMRTAKTRTDALALSTRKLTRGVTGVSTGAAGAATAMSGMNRSMKMTGATLAGRPFSQRLRNMSRDLLGFRGILFSMFVGAGAKKALTTFVSFETTMNKFSAVSLASAKQLAAVRKTAKDLGRTTMFTAAQVGDAMLSLKKLGLTVPETIQAVPGALELAAASGMDLAAAADLGLSTIRQFGLGLGDLGRVNDVLAKAQTLTGATIEQLGQSLKKAGVMAKVSGIDFETVVASLGAMGDVAIRGGIAGTYMMNLLRMIQSPRGETETIFDYLLGGAGEFRKQIADAGTGGFLKLIDMVQKSPQLEKRLLKLFNIRGGLGGLILSGAGSKRIRELTAALREADGFAKIAAAKRLGGLPGAFLMLKSAVEAVTLAFFDSGLAQIIEDISRRMVSWARSLAKVNPKILKMVGVMALVAVATLGFLVVLALLAATLGVLFTPFGAYVTFLTLFASSFALGYTTSEAFRGVMGGVILVLARLWEILNILAAPFDRLLQYFGRLFGTGAQIEGQMSNWQAFFEVLVIGAYLAANALAGMLYMLDATWRLLTGDWSGAGSSFISGLEKLDMGYAVREATAAMHPELAPALMPAPAQAQHAAAFSGDITFRASSGAEITKSEFDTQNVDLGFNMVAGVSG